MSSFRIPGPLLLYTDNDRSNIDEGTLCRCGSPIPGTIFPTTGYSYSISGTTGALGSMLFTEGMRIPGTWYDRTEQTTAFRTEEVALGRSALANKAFRKSAIKTMRNIDRSSQVDVNIHFVTKNSVENIMVRGRRGMQSFRFDFNAVQSNQKKLPKNADAFKPFLDTINNILAAVIQVR